MKECFKCHQIKPLLDFYCHARMADGHLNKCKACARLDAHLYRAMNMEHRLEYERRRNRTDRRRRDRASRNKRYREQHRQREAAYRAVRRALQTGRLTKPPRCEGCNRETDLHAHHQDYAQPLNVIWLCARCHAEHHHVRSFFGEAAVDH